MNTDEQQAGRFADLMQHAEDGDTAAIRALKDEFLYDFRTRAFTGTRQGLDPADRTDTTGVVADKTVPENPTPDEKLLAHYAFLEARFADLMEKADLGDPNAMDDLKFGFLYDYRFERAAEAYEKTKAEKAEAARFGGDRGDFADPVDVGGDL